MPGIFREMKQRLPKPRGWKRWSTVPAFWAGIGRGSNTFRWQHQRQGLGRGPPGQADPNPVGPRQRLGPGRGRRRGFAALRRGRFCPFWKGTAWRTKRWWPTWSGALWSRDSADAPPSETPSPHSFHAPTWTTHAHPDAIRQPSPMRPEGKSSSAPSTGGRVAWLPYRRPGFELAKEVYRVFRENPGLEGVVLARLRPGDLGRGGAGGLPRTALRIIGPGWRLSSREQLPESPFGYVLIPPLPREAERGRCSSGSFPSSGGFSWPRARWCWRWTMTPRSWASWEALRDPGAGTRGPPAQTTSSTPNGFPLFVSWRPEEGVERPPERPKGGGRDLRGLHRRRFEAHRQPRDRMFPPRPRVILIPGLGNDCGGPRCLGSGGESAALPAGPSRLCGDLRPAGATSPWAPRKLTTSSTGP